MRLNSTNGEYRSLHVHVKARITDDHNIPSSNDFGTTTVRVSSDSVLNISILATSSGVRKSSKSEVP